jgi:ATP-binding cassette subfamily B (MDR/TAP) protein 1
VLFAILLAALGIAQAQMSFPDITQAAAAIDRVFRIIDRQTQIDSGSDAGELLIDASCCKSCRIGRVSRPAAA